MMNTFGGSPGMRILEREVQKGILAEFQEIDRIGGVIEAIEHRYQRSQIQEAAHRYERQVNDGTRSIIGLNRYWNEKPDLPELKVVRTPASRSICRSGGFANSTAAMPNTPNGRSIIWRPSWKPAGASSRS